MNTFKIVFKLTSVEQLMAVRSLLMELAFIDIRNGYNPYECFAEIDSSSVVAVNEIEQTGSATLYIEDEWEGFPVTYLVGGWW